MPGRATARQPAGGRSGWWLRHRTLLAVTVTLTVAEAALLQGLQLHGSLGLAPQVAAPAPYDVFHDLRWLLVYHRSMLGFTFEALGMWAGRSALAAILLRAAWPPGDDRPGFLAAWRRSAGFTLVCAALMTPFAALMFGAGVASVSWLVLAAVPSVLAIAMLIGHGSAGRRWYVTAPPWRVVGWMLLAFAGYTVLAGALIATPGWLALPVAAVAGIFDAWAWRGIVCAVARRHERPAGRRLRPVPIVGLACFALVLTVGTDIGFHATRLHPKLDPPTDVAWGPGAPVMVVSGFGTPWSGAPPDYLGPGFTEWRFSYAGMTPLQRPVPYVGNETYQPLPVLVQRMAAEVRAFHRQTRRPVTIVAESEGALVAEAYVHATPGAPVNRLVVLSPLVKPGRVYYPPASGSGFGIAAGWELRGLSATLESLGSEAISGDNPFLRSVADHGPQLDSLLGCDVPGVSGMAVLPLADATSTPYAAGFAMPSVVVPGFHGGLLGTKHVQRIVARYLRDGVVPDSALLDVTDRAIKAGATAWQVPSLTPTANPAWSGLSEGSCAATARSLRSWLYESGPAAPPHLTIG
jgi:hypothetical protein